MEAVLALLLTLPTRIGGYGLPAPQLNYRVTTSIADRSASDRAYRVCDVYWPEWRIDLEYDSDLHHSGGGKIAQDAIRRNELVGKRISVITATRQHLFRPELLRATAEQIARLMGRKLRIRTAGFEEKQEILRRQLLFPRHLVSQNEVGRTCEQNATW